MLKNINKKHLSITKLKAPVAKPICLGLTGSIAMGKTTIAALFKKHHIPVYNADEAVHSLYHQENVKKRLRKTFPELKKNNAISREDIAAYLLKHPEDIKKLEEIFHPLVKKEREKFIKKQQKNGENLVVLEIPLLFESDNAKDMDKILVVTAPEHVQKKRALERKGMTQEKLSLLLKRQLNTVEKCAKADFIIYTDKSLEQCEEEVKKIIKILKI